MAQTSKSQRQILLNRAQKFQLSLRLKNNLSDLQQKQQRLSQSRCSSRSRQSSKSRRPYTVQKSPSPKIRILQNIVDKLKSPRVNSTEIPEISPIKTPTLLTQPPLPNKIQQTPIKDNKPKGKLQSMLKDIKKCNQQSTKAINSVKKGFNSREQFSNTTSQSRVLNSLTIPPQNNNINGKFNQLACLKEQLRRAKQQNKLLIQLIQINDIRNRAPHSPDQKCQLCGCTCGGRFSNPPLQYPQANPFRPQRLH